MGVEKMDCWIAGGSENAGKRYKVCENDANIKWQLTIPNKYSWMIKSLN